MGPACSDHRCEGWDGSDQLSPGWMAFDLRAGWVVEPGARGEGRACALSSGSRPLATRHQSAEDCRPREQAGASAAKTRRRNAARAGPRFQKCHPQSPPIGQGASCVNSRNIELLNGQSFLQTGFGGRRPTEPCISPIQWLGAASAGARTPCSFAPTADP